MDCRRSTPTMPPWVVCTVSQAVSTVAAKRQNHTENFICAPRKIFPRLAGPIKPCDPAPYNASAHQPTSDYPHMSRIPRSVFFLLFTVSGFAGLIYESIWSHYLKLFLGHAAYAQTL